MTKRFNRRSFLRAGALGAAAAAFSGGLSFTRRRAAAQPRADQRFLFVVTATGGGSIIDSFLPVAASEVSSPSIANRIIAYPDEAIVQPSGSNIRCVRNLGIETFFRTDYDLSTFVSKHYRDMAVVTVENTSVNHVVAQKRAITGAGIDGGRTIMERMAEHTGEDLLLANCNMSAGGYVEPGDAADVATAARAQIINDPFLFAVGTHGYRGVEGAPDDALIERARRVRERLEDGSPLGERFGDSMLRRDYLSLRGELQPRIEADGLLEKLLLLPSSSGIPLGEYGIELSAEHDATLARLTEVFPNLATDSLQTQAALGFLLAKHGISSAITIGPSFQPSFLPSGALADAPIAFDFSHGSHVPTQNMMWGRLMSVVDGLIELLQEVPHGGGSMWDQSLIYVATDFGRSKDRPAGSLTFGSGHHLNNGSLFVSPLLRGNQVYGGVDPDTCLTYGFDGASGEPDRDVVMREGHLYSLVCEAMGIDFDGKYDMSGLVR